MIRLTANQAAILTGFDYKTVVAAINDGSLPAKRATKRGWYRITFADLQTWAPWVKLEDCTRITQPKGNARQER